MATPQLPPPSNPAMLPVLATVTYVAAVVALWGILSVALNRDVIPFALQSPLLGPSMVAVAAVITWLVAWRARRPVLGAVVALVASWLGMILAAVIGFTVPACPEAQDCYYGFADSLTSPFDLDSVDIFLHFALSPFVAGAAVLAAFAVLAVAALRRAPQDSR